VQGSRQKGRTGFRRGEEEDFLGNNGEKEKTIGYILF
jgi:hypothetical protein